MGRPLLGAPPACLAYPVGVIIICQHQIFIFQTSECYIIIRTYRYYMLMNYVSVALLCECDKRLEVRMSLFIAHGPDSAGMHHWFVMWQL